MHIHVVPNRGSPPTVLLRESYREGPKVLKRTLANLSSLSVAQIEAIRATLRGDALAPAADVAYFGERDRSFRERDRFRSVAGLREEDCSDGVVLVGCEHLRLGLVRVRDG
jgi:hypothetical protein